MASYTIFGTAAPTLTPSGDTAEVSVATNFYVLGVTGWRCSGIRIFIPAGAAPGGGTKKAFLWTGTGSPTSIIATADFSSVLAGQWNTVYFSAPVSLITGRPYWAQVYLPAGGYGYEGLKFPSGFATVSVDVGTLYAAGGSEFLPGNGSFAYGPAGSDPDTTFNRSWYGVDAVVDDGTGSVGPGAADTIGLVDHTSVVRSGLPTAIHASGTATDIVGVTASASATFAVGGATALRTIRRSLFDTRIEWGSVYVNDTKGPTFADNTGTPITLGVEFILVWKARFRGCNIYKPPAAHGTIAVRLWNRLGPGGAPIELADTTVEWVADDGGWREITFPEPFVDLDIDTPYIVSYYSPSSDFCYSNWVFHGLSDCVFPFIVKRYIDGNHAINGGCFRSGTEQLIPDYHSATNYYIGPTVEWDSDLPLFVPDKEQSYWDRWINGKPSYKFMWGIYGCDPGNFEPYKALGINTLIGSPGDPVHVDGVKSVGWDFYPHTGTDADPNRLCIRAAAEDPAFSALVKGYYIVDEPDQLHPFAPPDVTQEWINSVRIVDNTRPIYLAMGRSTGENQNNWHQPQGSSMEVANALWREWAGQAEVLSADMYTMSPTEDESDTQGVWMYPVFLRRTRTLNEGRTPAYIAIETTSQSPNRPTPEEIYSACWSVIIEGTNGIEFFNHRFQSGIVDKDFAHILHNPPVYDKVKALIERVNSMAEACITPDTGKVTAWTSSNKTAGPRGGTWGVPMHFTTRADATNEYLFAMGIRPGATTATFTIPDWAGQTLTVLDESRTVTVSGAGVLTDNFAADYTVHLYMKGDAPDPPDPPSGFWQGLATVWPTAATTGPAVGVTLVDEAGGNKSGTHNGKRFTGDIVPQNGSVFIDCEVNGSANGELNTFQMTRCRIIGGTSDVAVKGNVLLEYCHITGGQDAIKVQGNGWIVRYNYVHSPYVTASSHNDGIQGQWLNTNGLCEGNYIAWTDTSEFFLQVQSGEPINNIIVRWNWFGGSDLPVRVETGCSASVYENAIKEGFYGYADFSGTLVRKDGNIDAITGALLVL